MRDGACPVLFSTTASLRYAIANVVSSAMASPSSATARSVSPASLARSAWEYFRSAASEPVVTCSSGSLARIVLSDSPMRSRSRLDSRSTASMMAPSSLAFSRKETSVAPSAAETSSADST